MGTGVAIATSAGLVDGLATGVFVTGIGGTGVAIVTALLLEELAFSIKTLGGGAFYPTCVVGDTWGPWGQLLVGLADPIFIWRQGHTGIFR